MKCATLNRTAMFATLLLSIVAGCGESSKEKHQGGDYVSARFNGHDLRMQDINTYSKLRVEMYRLMKPDADADSLQKVSKSTFIACLPYFIQNCIVLDESSSYKKGHGEYSEVDREAVRKWLDRQYAQTGSSTGTSIKSIRAVMAKRGLAAAFDQQIETEIESELFLRVACSNRYQITENVISNVYDAHVLNNYLATATNQTIMATASNVLSRVKAGEDFQMLADKYTMVPEELSGGDMGFCSVADFPGEEELWEAVKDLDAGRSTGLIDAGDSVQILKVLERDDSNQKMPRLHLARIYFRRAWVMDRPPRSAVIKALEDDRRQRLLKEILEKRLAVSKIEFPRGRKVFLDLTPAKPFLDIIEGRATNLVNKAGGMIR